MTATPISIDSRDAKRAVGQPATPMRREIRRGCEDQFSAGPRLRPAVRRAYGVAASAEPKESIVNPALPKV